MHQPWLTALLRGERPSSGANGPPSRANHIPACVPTFLPAYLFTYLPTYLRRNYKSKDSNVNLNWAVAAHTASTTSGRKSVAVIPPPPRRSALNPPRCCSACTPPLPPRRYYMSYCSAADEAEFLEIVAEICYTQSDSRAAA